MVDCINGLLLVRPGVISFRNPERKLCLLDRLEGLMARRVVPRLNLKIGITECIHEAEYEVPAFFSRLLRKGSPYFGFTQFKKARHVYFQL